MGSPLKPTCTTTTRADSIPATKEDGTEVRYYLFDEFEFHANTIPPGTVQGWHHHEQIAEVLFVTSGTIEARWVEDGNVVTRRLDPGDLLEVGASSHTVANPFNEPAQFTVFRFVPDGTNKRDLIKNDRHPDDPPSVAT